MVEVCILVRYPDGVVRPVLDEKGNVMVWPDRDRAIGAFEEGSYSSGFRALCALGLPWQLVELTEL